MSIAVAQQAKANNHLEQLVRTSAYGICTRRQRMVQAIADGCTLECAMVQDEARERKLERDIDSMRTADNGFYVPIGNQSHPITIKFNALKAELAARPTMAEYRLHRPDGAYFTPLSKTEFEFGKTL